MTWLRKIQERLYQPSPAAEPTASARGEVALPRAVQAAAEEDQLVVEAEQERQLTEQRRDAEHGELASLARANSGQRSELDALLERQAARRAAQESREQEEEQRRGAEERERQRQEQEQQRFAAVEAERACREREEVQRRAMEQAERERKREEQRRLQAERRAAARRAAQEERRKEAALLLAKWEQEQEKERRRAEREQEKERRQAEGEQKKADKRRQTAEHLVAKLSGQADWDAAKAIRTWEAEVKAAQREHAERRKVADKACEIAERLKTAEARAQHRVQQTAVKAAEETSKQAEVVLDVLREKLAELHPESAALQADEASRYIPAEVRKAVWARDGGACVQCGAWGPGAGLQYDHVLPFSRGGANTVKNLQLLCRKCNLKKGARL
jgi:5-methylcytosine-specific restriction endonuclease McrA